MKNVMLCRVLCATFVVATGAGLVGCGSNNSSNTNTNTNTTSNVSRLNPSLAEQGDAGLLVTYAHCCYPIPGDDILAFLSTGRGIVIHRGACANVADYTRHPENWLPVNWQATEGRLFLTEIRVEAKNRVGLLAAVSASIAAARRLAAIGRSHCA